MNPEQFREHRPVLMGHGHVSASGLRDLVLATRIRGVS